MATLRVGTRGSRLALAQTAIVVAALARAGIADRVETVELRTRGDEISARRPRGRWELADGQFTTELERALRDGKVDLVVHSLKDLPTAPAEGVEIAAVLERGDARDCLLTLPGGGLDDLPFGGLVATSSPRRAAQLAALRPDLIARPIRGNVDSRLRRLEAGEYDGLLLAAAGLDRLGVDVPHAARLSFEEMLPAPGQAALAVQVRAGDALRQRIEALDHVPSRLAVEAERRLLRRIGGGCLAPLGALGEVTDDMLRLRAAFEDRSGFLVRAEACRPAHDLDGAVEAVAADISAGVEAPA